MKTCLAPSTASAFCRRKIALALAGSIAALLAGPSVQADTLYWDGNGAGAVGNPPTANVGGAGTWDTGTTANWWNGTAYQLWNAAGGQDIADFRGTAGAVAVSGTVNVNTIQMRTGSYTFNTGTINFIGSGVFDANTVATTTFNATLSGSVKFQATGSGLTIASGSSAFINGNNTGLTSFELALNTAANNIVINHAGALGAAGATVKLTRGVLMLGNNAAPNNNVPITYNAWNTELAGGTIRARFSVSTLTGATTLSANSGLTTRAAAGVALIFDTTATINLGSSTLTSDSDSTAAGITLNGVISGAGNLKTDTLALAGGGNGAGLTTLGAANTFSGTATTTANRGTLALANLNALQNATLDTGAAAGTQAVTFTVAGTNTYNLGALTGSDALAIGANSISVGSKAGNTIFAGDISGGGGLTKVGSGSALTLSGAVSYGGATAVNAGTLNVTGSLTGTTGIAVAGNARLGGEGTTVSGVTFAAGGGFVFDPTTTGATDHFRATGVINTTAGATTKIVIDLAAAVNSGTGIVVFEGGSILTNGVGDFQLNSRGTLSLTATQLLFDYAAGSVVWKGGNGTNPSFWDVNTTAQNFTLGGVDNFFLSGDTVTFNDSASSFAVAVQGASVTPGSVNFDHTLNPYSLSGGAIVGSAVLTKNGGNTLTISNANTYNGGTAINVGTIQLGDGVNATGSLGTGLVTNNAALVTNFGTNTTTVANAITGTGTLTQNGNGTVILTGATSYNGATTINAGTLNFAPTVPGNLDTVIGGVGKVEKSGASTLTLDLANGYTGTTTVSAGGLIVAADGALGTAATGTTVAVNAALGLSGGITYSTLEAVSGSGPGTLVANTGAFVVAQRGFIQSVSGSNTFAGNIQLSANGQSRIGTQNGAQLTLTGAITPALGLTTTSILFRVGDIDGDFVTLSNAGNSWHTDATIFTGLAVGNAGVRLGVDNALPTGLTVSGLQATTGAGTALDLAGFDQSLNGLITGGGVLKIINTNLGDVSILTLNPTVNKATTNTTISNTGGGDIAVLKTGSFTQTLGGAHTYTGATTINGGQLEVTGSLTSAITVSPSAVLGGEGSTTGNLTFGPGSAIVFNPTTVGATDHFRSTGTINTTAGAGTKINVNLTTTVNSGTGIVVFEGGTITTNGLSDFKLNARGTLSLTATQLLFDYGVGSVVWKGANPTNPTFWDVNTTPQNFKLGGVNDVFFNGDSVLFDNTASNFAPAVQAALAADIITFDNTTPYTLTGAVVTANSLIKDGLGKVTIANTNSIQVVTINVGVVQLGDGVADVGSFGAAAAITNDATLIYDFGAVNASRSHAVDGIGAVIKNGSGKLTLTGGNGYNGATTINAGTLDFAPTVASTLVSAIGGVGNLEKSGTSNLTLPLANSFTGLTTVTAGTLIVQDAGALGTTAGGTVVANNARLELESGITVTGEAISISGNGGDFFGALRSRSGSAEWAGAVNIALDGARIGALAGSTLTVSGVIDSGANVFNVTYRPFDYTGLVVITGANTYIGSTSIIAGPASVSSLNRVVGGTPTSNLGAPTTPANGVINLGGTGASGTLVYTGAGETTDRVINLGGTTGGAGIDQSGTGLLKFTSDFTATFNGAKTLTLLGSTAGTGEIAGAIVNSLNATAVTKMGTGLWTLSGLNLYTGGTAVNDGILNVNADTALGAIVGPVAISNGATLQAGGTVTTAARTVTLGAGGGRIDTNGNIVNLDAGSTVTGSTLTKTGAGTLNLAGTQTYATLITSGGTTNVNSVLGTGTSTVNANATTNFGVSQTLEALNIGTVSMAAPLSVAAMPTAVVPEPGALSLLAVGALGLAGRRRRSTAAR